MKKRCFKCKRTKDIEQFYKHPRMHDGRLGKCKACTKKDMAARYADPQSRARIQAYEYARTRSPHRRKKALEYQVRRRAKAPGKNRARGRINNAVRTGRLAKQPCEVCGDPKVSAHHPDYRKPLYIRWLCKKHHWEAHGYQIKAA
jgi:hypothetical protein